MFRLKKGLRTELRGTLKGGGGMEHLSMGAPMRSVRQEIQEGAESLKEAKGRRKFSFQVF